MSEPQHIPVLLNEVVDLLAPATGDVIVDCTAGFGGHASALAARVGPTGTLVLMDLDPGNLERAAARVRALDAPPRIVTHHGSFADAARVMTQHGLAANVVLADLGFASPQMDDASRGLSFMREGPLDMRLNPLAPITAAELVNTLPAPELAELLREFGDEQAAKVIAQKIVQSRASAPITTTTQLASIIRTVVPRRAGVSIDPATKSFQALRIAVNDELGSLDRLLDAISRGGRCVWGGGRGGRGVASGSGTPSWLAPGARVGIISFHSLEDRRVKQSFAALVEQGIARHISKGVVSPGDGEIDANPRSRSAKLRVIKLVSLHAQSTGTGQC